MDIAVDINDFSYAQQNSDLMVLIIGALSVPIVMVIDILVKAVHYIMYTTIRLVIDRYKMRCSIVDKVERCRGVRNKWNVVVRYAPGWWC